MQIERNRIHIPYNIGLHIENFQSCLLYKDSKRSQAPTSHFLSRAEFHRFCRQRISAEVLHLHVSSLLTPRPASRNDTSTAQEAAALKPQNPKTTKPQNPKTPKPQYPKIPGNLTNCASACRPGRQPSAARTAFRALQAGFHGGSSRDTNPRPERHGARALHRQDAR